MYAHRAVEEAEAVDHGEVKKQMCAGPPQILPALASKALEDSEAADHHNVEELWEEDQARGPSPAQSAFIPVC